MRSYISIGRQYIFFETGVVKDQRVLTVDQLLVESLSLHDKFLHVIWKVVNNFPNSHYEYIFINVSNTHSFIIMTSFEIKYQSKIVINSAPYMSSEIYHYE